MMDPHFQMTYDEAACGGSALTAELGALADQFECHALSRSIDDIEAAGRAMRAAMTEIERLRDALQKHDAWLGQAHCLCSDMGIPHGHIEDRLFEAIGKVPNAIELTGSPLAASPATGGSDVE